MYLYLWDKGLVCKEFFYILISCISFLAFIGSICGIRDSFAREYFLYKKFVFLTQKNVAAQKCAINERYKEKQSESLHE